MTGLTVQLVSFTGLSQSRLRLCEIAGNFHYSATICYQLVSDNLTETKTQ